MRISWEECDPESGVITQVLGRSYRDHEEASPSSSGAVSGRTPRPAVFATLQYRTERLE